MSPFATLEITIYNERFYVRVNRILWNSPMSSDEIEEHLVRFGCDMMRKIPADPELYSAWLHYTRAKYRDMERALEQNVYGVCGRNEPDPDHYDYLAILPTHIPQLGSAHAKTFHSYTVNLDDELFTVNHSRHFRLGELSRDMKRWKTIVQLSYQSDQGEPIEIVWPEGTMLARALEARQLSDGLEDKDLVAAQKGFTKPFHVLLGWVLIQFFCTYKTEYRRFSWQWVPKSFAFRELSYALVSIASGAASYHSFPERPDHPCKTHPDLERNGNYTLSPGWLNRDLAGDDGTLLEFRTPSHRPDQPPGAAPAETMYWFQNVLVSLVLVVDDLTIDEAMSWGLEQGRTNFQIVVLSLSEVAFAEVRVRPPIGEDKGKGKGKDLGFTSSTVKKYTKPMHLWPQKDDEELKYWPQFGHMLNLWQDYMVAIGSQARYEDFSVARQKIIDLFPGIGALVNFFDMAANRQLVGTSQGCLPPEIYDRVLDFTNYKTWKICSTTSSELRRVCLNKYRLTNQMRIVGGPFMRLSVAPPLLLSFDFQDMETGEVARMAQYTKGLNVVQDNFMPVIGKGSRKVVMPMVTVQFHPDLMRRRPKKPKMAGDGDGPPGDGPPRHDPPQSKVKSRKKKRRRIHRDCRFG